VFVKSYRFEETGVGCKAHDDPECLCDVVISEPVEVKHSLGFHSDAVLFSNTAHRKKLPVRACLETHMGMVLGLYDAAAQTFRGKSLLAKADETIAVVDRREHEGDHRSFNPTPEQEGWMRRQIPNTQAAFIVDQNTETVRAWRKRNGVVIDLGPSDFQIKNSRPMKPKKETKARIDFDSDDVDVLLSDRSLSAVDVAGRLGVSKNTVVRQRQARGIHGAAVGGVKTNVDWTHPDTLAVLDGNLSEREAGRALGVAQTTVARYRKRRATVSN
jgi:hypothetical protein